LSPQREKDLEVAARIGQLLLERNDLLEQDLARLTEQKTSVEQQVKLQVNVLSLLMFMWGSHFQCCLHAIFQLRQVQHTVLRKEELLRLYASEQEEQAPPLGKEGGVDPDWVQVLTEECKELRESNIHLQAEADKLRRETAEVEQKEKELVQQCLEQFSKYDVTSELPSFVLVKSISSYHYKQPSSAESLRD